ncbi:MAG: exonuclease SbcCD subunit D [Lachnospiraceae bacterium]|nr:exonuclease SbcCD subunit D [Lachnospiraceae bacterium]
MKFLHTADLHIGKKIFELSLIEDQKYILSQIYDIARREAVDAVIIAGDVYDRAVPSTEAVELLDEFLTRLQEAHIPVIMISGNHDSPERVSFADAILEKQGIYISGCYQEPLKTVTLEDEHGPVHFVCMPFVKPAVVEATSSAEAVEHMLSHFPMTLSLNQRYVLVTHYFVTGENGQSPELSDSETDVNVGGLDNVPADYFANFCYVALGHIHKPQHIGNGQVYYSGSPLKYSFSEAQGEKSVNIVELGERGTVSVRREILKPLREMRCIKGRLSDLMSGEVIAQIGEGCQDYMQATLTDTEELIDPIGTLRSVYPNVLHIMLEKNMPAGEADEEYESKLTAAPKSTTELFAAFYEIVKGESLDEKRRQVVEEIVAEVKAE